MNFPSHQEPTAEPVIPPPCKNSRGALYTHPKPQYELFVQEGHPPAAHPKLHGAVVGEGRGGLGLGFQGLGLRASGFRVLSRIKG